MYNYEYELTYCTILGSKIYCPMRLKKKKSFKKEFSFNFVEINLKLLFRLKRFKNEKIKLGKNQGKFTILSFNIFLIQIK